MDFRSFIIDHLKQLFSEDDVVVAFIYCNYNEREEQTLVNLLGSLLQQFVQQRSTIPTDLQKVYESHERKKTRPSVAEYSRLLESQLSSFSEAFLVIDALDEYLDNDRTRDALLAEIRKLQPRLRLLVTSRPNVKNLALNFDNVTQLEIRASDSDIKRYLESEIYKKERLRSHVTANPTLKDIIINTIVQKAEGMSVSVSFVLETFIDHFLGFF